MMKGSKYRNSFMPLNLRPPEEAVFGMISPSKNFPAD
jgi:hypothetical protein